MNFKKILYLLSGIIIFFSVNSAFSFTCSGLGSQTNPPGLQLIINKLAESYPNFQYVSQCKFSSLDSVNGVTYEYIYHDQKKYISCNLTTKACKLQEEN